MFATGTTENANANVNTTGADNLDKSQKFRSTLLKHIELCAQECNVNVLEYTNYLQANNILNLNALFEPCTVKSNHHRILKNHGKPWSVQELQSIVQLWKEHNNVAIVAKCMDRSFRSIECQLIKMKILNPSK